MKRRHQRTYDNIKANNAGTHWSDVEDLLKSGFGAEVYEGTGATVTFVVEGVKLVVDRPHPRRECGRGLVARVKAFIEEVE